MGYDEPETLQSQDPQPVSQFLMPNTAYVVETPEAITPKDIDEESNAEVRRIMIERYGPARYLKDDGAVKVSEDRFGTLWRKGVDGDEPIVMVEVIDSTPMPNGERNRATHR